MLAPVGCLQYYNGASGMVQSFNYMQDIGTPANLEGVNHLANLNYAACVRMESGYCGIRWSQVNRVPPSTKSINPSLLDEMFSTPGTR